jgi:uncharacterized iron-regulated membrane protein
VNSTRAVFKIHSWLGLITGAFMLVVCLSGAYLVYRAELDRYFNPDIRIRPLAAHPASIDAMLRSVRERFPSYNMGYVMFPADPHAPFTAYLREVAPDGSVIRHQVYVDAGTGQVFAHRISYHFLTDWMVRFHEGLWLPDFWGEPLVALLGIALAASGLTGLWVYRRKVWDALRWKKTTQRLGRLHSHLGVWSLLFAILLGVTGTVLNYNSLVVLIGRSPPVPLMGVPWSFLDHLPSADALVAESRQAFPALEEHYIYYPRSGPNNLEDDIVKVAGRIPDARLLGSASSYVDFAAGPLPKVTAVYDARRASLGRRLFFMTAALHYGDFAGQYSKIPYLVGGLVLAFLAGSGLWIYLRPRRSFAAAAGLRSKGKARVVASPL